MNATLHNPAFLAYVIASLLLCLNLLFLWGYSGAVRARTGTAINPEDSLKYHVPLATDSAAAGLVWCPLKTPSRSQSLSVWGRGRGEGRAPR